MDKVLATTLLTMGAVVAAIMVVNTILPALGRSGSSVVSSSGAAASRLKTDVKVIHVSTDTTSTPAYIYVYVKNVGANNVLAIDQSDVFLETSTTFDRLTHTQVGLTTDCATKPESTDGQGWTA